MAKINSSLVEVYIFRKVKKGFEYLILKRAEKVIFPSIWQMVSGSIEEGEKAYEAALREVKEETGLDSVRLYVAPVVSVFYYNEKDTIEQVPVFICEAGDSEVRLSEEHVDFKWTKAVKAEEKLNWLNWKNNIKLIDKILNDEKLFTTLIEVETGKE